jgi:hypothetical protein
MSVNKFIILLIATFGIVTCAFAANKSRELALDGNYINIQGQPSASLLNISLGQFMTPQFVVETALSTQHNFGYSATSINLGGKYYFMDSNHGSTEYGAKLGVSYFLSDSTTLDAKATLLNYNDSSPAITLLSAGFSQRF